MWKTINYKDKNSQPKSNNSDISPEIIHRYFTAIFQAEHLAAKPTVDDIKEELNNYSVVHDYLDDDFSYDELNKAIMSSGRGIGIDGLEKMIAHLFPKKLRTALLLFFNKVYNTIYPNEWTYQILRPETKKGHSVKTPKLRGVAISSMLPTIYDIMIDNRFKPWYKINPEQAGFRELMGCLIQIFALYLLMELARSLGESIFIGFIDYEKAFDFVNRFDVVKDLMLEGAGAKFVKAIANMYLHTYYVPKITASTTGEPILAKHGVTQGRKSSTSLFSFTMRNIPKSVSLPPSFLQGNHVFQLADDSSIATNTITELNTGFGQLIDGSELKFMVTNVAKTFYLHLHDNPIREELALKNGYKISPAKNDEHLYLGMWFLASSDLTLHTLCNLSHRAFNINMFTDWLHINEMTPINIKIQVLDSCMFAAYLYGCECWFTIDEVAEKILVVERKLLKQILQVKPNTPNEMIYTELGRCDMVSTIKVRQKNFFRRCQQLNKEEASLKTIMELCKHLEIFKYYESLEDGIAEHSKDEMKQKINAATTTYCMKYKEITGAVYNDAIYGQFLREDKRVVLTRWRLSSHKLNIEEGRHTTPFTPRNERTCSTCTICIEDEHHVIFNCPLYNNVRIKFPELFTKLPTIDKFLSPTNIKDASDVGEILLQIKEIRSSEKL